MRRAHASSSAALDGLAEEDPPAARRVARAGRIERAREREGVEVRVPDRVERVVRAADERLQPQRVHGGRPLEERDRDRVRAGLERHAERRALLDVVARLRHVLEIGLEVLVAADPGQMHALAVDRELELMRVFQAAHDAQIGAEQADAERVLAVERQRHVRENPAGRADRQSFDVRVLRRVLTDAEGLAGRLRFRIADRQRRDLVGRRQIALEQDRRHAERVGDVVEAVRRIVGRQHRRGVDVEREQIANRVGVFHAIQPMNQSAPRIRLRQPRRDPARSSGTTRARAPSPDPDAARPAAASCRRAPCARLSPTRPRPPATLDRSNVSSDRPPVLVRSLWQVTQYLSTTAR